MPVTKMIFSVEAWVRVRWHQFYGEQSHMMNDQKTNSFEVHREEKSTISPLFTATNKQNK